MSPEDRLERDCPRVRDAIGYPAGIDRWGVLRALDRERLDAEAADLPPARRRRIAHIRDRIRRGEYLTEGKLAVALLRAFEDLARGERPRRRL
jgi:hypothetical protein